MRYRLLPDVPSEVYCGAVKGTRQALLSSEVSTNLDRPTEQVHVGRRDLCNRTSWNLVPTCLFVGATRHGERSPVLRSRQRRHPLSLCQHQTSLRFLSLIVVIITIDVVLDIARRPARVSHRQAGRYSQL